MGRMKEIFIEMREQEEQMEENKHIKEQYSSQIFTKSGMESFPSFDSNIVCPNCLKSNLLEYSFEDLYCDFCGQEFIKVEKNRVRFK